MGCEHDWRGGAIVRSLGKNKAATVCVCGGGGGGREGGMRGSGDGRVEGGGERLGGVGWSRIVLDNDQVACDKSCCCRC